MSSSEAMTERIPSLTFLTNFLIGGTERQVLNLVQNLDRTRFDVHLACFRLAGPLFQEIDGNTVALSAYPITTLPSPQTVLQQARLARYIRSHRIRIVHSFGFYANVFAIPAARLAGVEVVVASIRDTGDHLTRLQRSMQKWACWAADHVLVNAEAIRVVLIREGYDPSRISVIPNGIDTSRFKDRTQTSETATTITAPTSLRATLGFPAGAPLVAVFSRLNRLKGIEFFLDAVALLVRSHDDVRFLIVGDSVSQEYREELEQRSAALGLKDRVAFTGFRTDVAELLSDVSVSVLPSLAEGLSNTVLEAMAAGVPVVATAVGGTPELVDDGVTGLLVPPRDAAALGKAIGSLLDDPARARSIGQAAKQRVIERFSLEATIGNTQQLYERLLPKAMERKPRSVSSAHADAVRLSPPPPPVRD